MATRRSSVKALEHYDFSDVDICLMSAGSPVSKEWSPKIAAAGAIVIDNSSCWRYDADVPLIVPEVNADAVAGFRKKGIIANPELLDRAARGRAQAAARQGQDHSAWWSPPISRFPAPARRRWTSCSRKPSPSTSWTRSTPKKFPKRIAFNVIPHIDVFMDDGFTKEEWKMVAETKKILDPKIKLVATCVRVPVFVGHSEAVSIEFENPITAEEAREMLRNAPGCLVDRQARGRRLCHALRGGGRGRHLYQPHPRGPDGRQRPVLWCVSDNLRKGAALNAIQIAECLINRKLIAAKRKAA